MSAILSADDLNDFISPGVACIKPVETLPQKPPQEEDPYEVTKEDKVQPENLPPAEISLTDCLACSGCVTSAEAVLVSLQSHAEVLNSLDAHPRIPLEFGNDGMAKVVGNEIPDEGRIFVASISPQVRASLAATYGITEKEAGYMIDQFLRGPHGIAAGGKHGSGFTWVVDTNVAREAVLVLTADEVEESLNTNNVAPNGASDLPPKRPVLSSACPGWVCYAEKTHPFVLPHLSRMKSPQALMGTFFKTVLSKALRVSPSRIWHLAVMPCFDKKLEASREELTDLSWRPDEDRESQPIRDVDCVITSRELLSLASSRGLSLPNLPLKALPQSFTPPFPDKTLHDMFFSKQSQKDQTLASSTSGGYLYHVLKTFESRNSGSQIVTQRGRNADVVEYILMSPDQQLIMKAARYYGFRNIQNLVRKLKPARASRLPGAKTTVGSAGGIRRQPMGRNAASSGGPDYAYVEVMACPGGCTNGGGQTRIEDAKQISSEGQQVTPSGDASEAVSSKPSPHEQRAWLARVDEAYFSADDSNSEGTPENQPSPSIAEKETRIHDVMQYWSRMMSVPLSKLVRTTYHEVESDVGKTQEGSNDTTRVVELAGKIGGGW